ncbi:ATP-binding protein [uncultured Cellulomonas sp.]|uniref:AAA family ATPase n=1 Tax=uncultured Cellulomonas sp. TaxID=189682 RepID=UPI00262D1EB0|nr:ATP-binding protein [uncultured Cellulomonas sp.]
MVAQDEEARAFARSFRQFLEWVHTDAAGSPRQHPVVARIGAHLGAGGLERSIVTRELPLFEHVNVQVALDRWMAAPGRTVDVEGVALPANFGPVELNQLLHGEHLPPVRLSAPDLIDLPSGPGQTTACLRSALLLVTDDRGRYVLFVRGPQRHHEPLVTLEVAGLVTADAQALMAELDELRHRHNVYRGKLLELAGAELGGGAVGFPVLPSTAREDVVLPEAVLHRVERHTLHVAAQREALLAAGQHLKRGLLLYGPPGTGKTHTTRYVVQHVPGSTVLMLSGRSLHLIGLVTQMARELAPSVVVLEDVDLVAEDRGHGPGANPVLFELLDAMDGAAADADLLFLLTTNRADLLEPALAARPGRVDVAIEIGLPDADARERLLEVYTRGVPLELGASDVAEVVRRTEGVTASFIKELVRRAVLEALGDHGGVLGRVTPAHVGVALDDLLDSAQGVTRALLGVPADPAGAPAGAADQSVQRGGHGGAGWLAAPDEDASGSPVGATG